jgi:hypothetical protein
MPLTQHELQLRTLAVDRIGKGLLPARLPKTIWAGPGSGEPCSLCDRVIDKAELEYELDNPAATANSVVRLHLRCHAVLQLELARLAEQPESVEQPLPSRARGGNTAR